jgi:5'-nucleotidase
LIILLTNDDGFHAEGLQAFSEAMREIGEVYVVAPDQGRSCCSHAVTTHQELTLNPMGNREWTVSGTPADCVRVALRWLHVRPDWIVSGVNEGGNLGVDLHYSGTVAGAREGRLLGVPSMAISQYLRRDRARDWKLSAQRARFAFQQWSSIPLADRAFWNINLPVVDHREIELNRIECLPEPQMLHFEFESSDASGSARDPNSPSSLSEQIIYRSNYQLRPRQEGSDVARCFGGAIVATQLSIDLI